ncbi:MAG: PLDc N-terminal domain-containing protein [Acidimicrobiales bacterium]
MILAAEFGVGEVLWAIFWFSVIALWVVLVFTIFGDIIRNHDLSGVAKAAWAAAIILFPYLGVLAYLVVNGDEMSYRILERG